MKTLLEYLDIGKAKKPYLDDSVFSNRPAILGEFDVEHKKFVQELSIYDKNKILKDCAYWDNARINSSNKNTSFRISYNKPCRYDGKEYYGIQFYIDLEKYIFKITVSTSHFANSNDPQFSLEDYLEKKSSKEHLIEDVAKELNRIEVL